MKNRKVKFGIVGCGNIGKRHIAVLDAHLYAEVDLICDIDQHKVNEQAGLYGLRYEVDFNTFLEKTDADFINICTPHGLHAEMAISSMRKGFNVLVEKPMSIKVEDAQRMINVSKEENVKLLVVKQNRFNVPIKMTKALLDENKLGKIYMVLCDVLWNRNKEYYSKSNWRGHLDTEGGALYTQVSHFLDLMIWWFGPVVSSSGFIGTKLHDIEVEDCGVASMNFSSGTMGNLTWTTTTYNKNYKGSITLIGEHGTIKIGGQYLNRIEYWDVKSVPLPDPELFVDLPNNYGKYQGTSSNHDKVIDQVVKYVQDKEHSVVHGEEGLLSIEAIEMLYKNCINAK